MSDAPAQNPDTPEQHIRRLEDERDRERQYAAEFSGEAERLSLELEDAQRLLDGMRAELRKALDERDMAICAARTPEAFAKEIAAQSVGAEREHVAKMVEGLVDTTSYPTVKKRLLDLARAIRARGKS